MLVMIIIRGCCDWRLPGLEMRRLHLTAEHGAVRSWPVHPGTSHGGADPCLSVWVGAQGEVLVTGAEPLHTASTECWYIVRALYTPRVEISHQPAPGTQQVPRQHLGSQPGLEHKRGSFHHWRRSSNDRHPHSFRMDIYGSSAWFPSPCLVLSP